MASMTKFLILISAVVAISGETIDLTIDKERPGTMISYRKEMLDTLARLKLMVPNYDERDYMFPLQPRYYDAPPPSPKTDTIKTKPIVSLNGNWRVRRTALAKTEGDEPAASAMPLTSTSSPLNLNVDDVNFTTTNAEVRKWLRQQLNIMMMNQIQKSTLGNRNPRASLQADLSSKTIEPLKESKPNFGLLQYEAKHIIKYLLTFASLNFLSFG